MKTSFKATALLTALAFSSVIQFTLPAQAREASATQMTSLQNNGSYLSADSLLAQYRYRGPYRANERQVQQLLDRLERDTDRFRSSLDSALDDSRLNGRDREDNVNRLVKDFEQATDRLRDRFDDRRSVSADVQEVFNRAERIDNIIRRLRLGSRAESDWNNVRRDLNELARVTNGVRYRYR